MSKYKIYVKDLGSALDVDAQNVNVAEGVLILNDASGKAVLVVPLT